MNLTELKNRININYVISLILIVVIIFLIITFFSNSNQNISKIPQSVPIQNSALFSPKAIDYNSINFDIHYILNSPKENSLGAGKIYVEIKNLNFYNNPNFKSQKEKYTNQAKKYLEKYGINPNGSNIVYTFD